MEWASVIKGGERRWTTLLLGGLLSLGVIVGLLNMCALDAHGVGTHTTTVSSSWTSTDGAAHAPESGHPTPAAAENSDHSGVAMACIMALLAFLTLLVPPPGSRTPALRRVHHHLTTTPGRIVSRARPSLQFLCISRT